MKIYKLNHNTCTPKQRKENKTYMLQLDHAETDQNPKEEETPLHSSCGIEHFFCTTTVHTPQAENQLQAMQKITSNLLQIMY
jgi:hypothetical protein